VPLLGTVPDLVDMIAEQLAAAKCDNDCGIDNPTPREAAVVANDGATPDDCALEVRGADAVSDVKSNVAEGDRKERSPVKSCLGTVVVAAAIPVTNAGAIDILRPDVIIASLI
jgi:hypothetical protein